MSHVIACIDGSKSTEAVCDYAIWANQRLHAPLIFLQVLDQQHYPAKVDLSGNIGLGSREHLLQQLATLDEQRSKLALEEGRLLLEAVQARATAAGVTQPHARQRHGNLLESLRELENETRLLIIGKQGSSTDSINQLLRSDLENVIRATRRPILVTPDNFQAPQSVMLAFDGSATSEKGVRMLATSPLFQQLPIHVVTVQAATADGDTQLQSACDVLAHAGFTVHAATLTGEVEPALHAYQAEHGIDLLVMGAYGHSRIRQFLVGSTTTNMIRSAIKPVLLLR